MGKSDRSLGRSDFCVVWSDKNGNWVKLEELNAMIECGAVVVDNSKLCKYRFESVVQYDRSKYTVEEAMKVFS